MLYSLLSEKLVENGVSPETFVVEGNVVDDRAISRSDVEDWCRTSQLTSVIPCSILGSFLAQDIVKAVTKSGKPDSSVFLFIGKTMEVKALPMNIWG